jgi:ribose transport system substrate-binding protein
MKRLRIVVSLPNDNSYQHEQRAAAKSAAQRLGLDLQVIQAADDSTTQNQQLLKIIESSADTLPNAFIVEPLSATGLRRVAEAAVSKGIAWVMSNSEVDYIKQLRKSPGVPVFTVTQGQREIGLLQGKQLAALLPQGGSVLYAEGPSMSSVAVQRREGMETTKPRNMRITTIHSNWNEESAYQSAATRLGLAVSRGENFDLVAGQSHELALGARKAFRGINNQEQREKWLGLPFIGSGIAGQVKPLVDGGVLAAAVITSVTMELALKLLMRAFETRVQPAERSVVDALSYPELEKLAEKATLQGSGTTPFVNR